MVLSFWISSHPVTNTSTAPGASFLHAVCKQCCESTVSPQLDILGCMHVYQERHAAHAAETRGAALGTRTHPYVHADVCMRFASSCRHVLMQTDGHVRQGTTAESSPYLHIQVITPAMSSRSSLSVLAAQAVTPLATLSPYCCTCCGDSVCSAGSISSGLLPLLSPLRLLPPRWCCCCWACTLRPA